MADTTRAWLRAGAKFARYGAVALGLIALGAVANAQQTQDIPLSPEEAKWFAATDPAPPAAKPKDAKAKPAIVGKPAAAAVSKPLPAPPAPKVTLPVPTTASEGLAAAQPPAPIVKRSGLKGVPPVMQHDLPPVHAQPVTTADFLTTGALPDAVKSKAAAGVQAKSDASKAAPAVAQGTAPADAAAAAQTAPAPTPPVPAAAPAPEIPPAAPLPQVPVTIGIYINDLQDIDFRTNSYLVDLYMWFRWKGKDIDPVKSVEFMNVFDPQNGQKAVLLDAPKEMPDGSLYNIVRYHGRFSKKFLLEKYPFDSQSLEFIIEDSVSPQSQQIFVPDTRGIGMNPSMTLPGFKFRSPQIDIAGYTYPTDFGDLSAATAETYSRAVVSVPLTRPMFTLAIKTFGPILLIVICATLVFFINPHFVEGRIGLAITALLTLVAIQFTAAASLPDADYFTMLDKLYMLSYAFIIASLVRVVKTSWQTVEGSLQDHSVAKRDHSWGLTLLLGYAMTALLITSWVLAK